MHILYCVDETGTIGERYGFDIFIPIVLMVINVARQGGGDNLIESFDLAVGLRMVRVGEDFIDPQSFAELLH